MQHIFTENRIRYIEKLAYSQIEATFGDEKIESFLALPISDKDQPSMLVLESEKCFAFEMKKQVDVQITVSIGMASIPEHTVNLLDLITFADKALYVGAKQAGRNRVAVYKKSMSN